MNIYILIKTKVIQNNLIRRDKKWQRCQKILINKKALEVLLEDVLSVVNTTTVLKQLSQILF